MLDARTQSRTRILYRESACSIKRLKIILYSFLSGNGEDSALRFRNDSLMLTTAVTCINAQFKDKARFVMSPC